MIKAFTRMGLLAAAIFCAGLLFGQTAPKMDADGDGLPDEFEVRLGTDPKMAERLEVVWEAKTKAFDPAKSPREIRRVFVANVAGNRYLWVLEFAADFTLTNTNLTLFVDADNNPKHGQKGKDVMGTDFVMWLSDGGRCCHGYSLTGEGASPAPTRFAWLDRRVLICTDMPIAQENGKSRFRFWAKCETLEPRAEISSTGWVAVTAAGESERPKPPVIAVGLVRADTTDTDGDSLPDWAEERLGTDPKSADRLDVIFDAATAADAANRKKKLAAAPDRSISKILFGNVAQDRFLWCVEFGADYPIANSGFILYLDADNDPKNGRKDVPGVDFMLGASEGSGWATAFAPNGDSLPGPMLRTAVVGKRLWLCADLPIHQEGGRSVYRASALSEIRSPARGVDSTGWFAVRGAAMSERKKAFMLDDCLTSENVEMTRGLDLFRALKSDTVNVVIKIGNCIFEGFEDDLRSEYKERSAVRTVAGGRIFVPVPKDGRFHVGFLLYDQAGTEKVEIRRGAQRLGLAVADEDDNRTKLFFTRESYDLKRGEMIELRTALAPGSYRVEDILLLAQRPEVRPRVFELSDLEVTPVWDGDAVRPGVMRVTWITTWPARCTVRYSQMGGAAQEVTEKEEFANHRIYLEGLKPDAKYEVRVIAPKPKGGEVVSDVVTFPTSPPVINPKVERRRLSLTARNPSADNLVAWPVTSGIPFPQGLLDSGSHLRLLGSDDSEKPLQARTLARWPDGSVRWVLLSFLADVAAKSNADYALEYGASVKPKVSGGLSVEEQPDGVSIVTGPMRVFISKQQVSLPGQIWLDRNGDGSFTEEELVIGQGRGMASLVDDAGREFTSLGPAEEIVVEENGPVRACVLIKGHHKHVTQSPPTVRKHFAYEARIMAYAGQKFLRVFYTFGNDVLTSEFASVRSLHLTLPLEGGATRYELGVETALSGDVLERPTLFQDLDDHYSVSLPHRRIEGRRAAGWVRVTGRRGSVIAAVRDFWKFYPKSLEVRPDGIAVGLMPPLSENAYAEQAKDPARLVHLFYNLLGGRYKVKQGQTKTHEVLVSFESDPARTGLDAFQDGVAATAPSEWVCGSRALGEISPAGTAWSTLFDKQMDKAVANYIKARDDRRDYGMMNYGDWWGERGFNWANIEYDDAHVWLMQFARTGDMRCLMVGDRAAKHYADVDCIHYHSDPRRVGAGYAHCIGHVGGFFKTNPVEGGTLSGGHSPCHTRTEGLVEHYLLTGDRRSFQAALGIADRYNSWFLNNYDFTNCRIPGWHIVLTKALYDATADPFYLNAAKIIARRVIERESPEGGWPRCLVPGHCYCLPRHRGEAGFMVGVLLSGLKYYHQATGDARAAEALVRAARYLVRETYDAATNQFRYTTCPNSSKPSATGNLACEGFAYAARLTGAPDLIKLTRDVTTDVLSRAAGGSASVVRFVPRAIWDLDRLGSSRYGLTTQDGFEILAQNEQGEDFTIKLSGADLNALVEVVTPSGRVCLSVRLPKSECLIPVVASGERGVYRIRMKGAGHLVTSLDKEALLVGRALHVGSDGLFRLALAIPPSQAPPAGSGAIVLKGLGDGDYEARLTGHDCNEIARLNWRGGLFSSPVSLKVGAEKWGFCELEVRGPTGGLEIQLQGLPPYVSAPSGKFFCPARPVAAFSYTAPRKPGDKPEVKLDASGSFDLDNDIVDYVWTFDDGTVLNGREVTRLLGDSKAKEWRVTLQVQDMWGFSDSCTQAISLPPTWLLQLDAKTTVLLEAEEFSDEGLGQVRLFERIGASGRMISYWHEVIGHWLEWRVTAPKTGNYRVILKYATDCEETLRDLKVDGVYAGDAFRKFHLPRTGGFCTAKDDWAYYTIGGEKTPATLRLTAGPHTIRMTNLKDGCALDFIILTAE